jgi:hypothetical protein
MIPNFWAKLTREAEQEQQKIAKVDVILADRLRQLGIDPEDP